MADMDDKARAEKLAAARKKVSDSVGLTSLRMFPNIEYVGCRSRQEEESRRS